MKLKYRMPLRQLLWHRRWTIAVVGVLALVARVGYAYLVAPGAVELQGLRRLATAFTPDRSKLPVYEIHASDRNLKKLTHPGDDRTVKVKSYADAAVHYTDPRRGIQQLGQAKLRVRGFNYSDAHAKKNLKIVLKDTSIDGVAEMHLLSDELKLGQAHWYPWHMWLASELGLKVPRTRFVRVKLNGVDWGLYVEVEHWGESLLRRYELAGSELYGEDDYYPYNVDYYLYDNVARWKKYRTGAEEDNDFSHLDRWLTFLRDSDDQMFRRQVFSFVDKDNVVAWHVHMALMDSYHQNSARNVRMLHNKDTGLFEFLPWDALPGILNTVYMMPYETYVVSRLSLRLKSHPEFMSAYSRKLYQAILEHQPQFRQRYMAMYANDDVTYAVCKDQRRGKSPFFDLGLTNTYIDQGISGGLRNVFCSWRYTSSTRCNRIGRTWRRLKGLLESAIVFAVVDRHPLRTTGDVRTWKVAIGYDSHVPAEVEGLRLPITNWPAFDGQDVTVTLALRPRPRSKVVYQPLFPRDMLPEPVTHRGTARISNGYLVVDDCRLTLMPGYPKLEKMMVRTDAPVRGLVQGDFMGALETQEYTLLVDLPATMEPVMPRLELQVRNTATLAQASIDRKVVNSADYALCLRRSQAVQGDCPVDDPRAPVAVASRREDWRPPRD